MGLGRELQHGTWDMGAVNPCNLSKQFLCPRRTTRKDLATLRIAIGVCICATYAEWSHCILGKCVGGKGDLLQVPDSLVPSCEQPNPSQPDNPAGWDRIGIQTARKWTLISTSKLGPPIQFISALFCLAPAQEAKQAQKQPCSDESD